MNKFIILSAVLMAAIGTGCASQSQPTSETPELSSEEVDALMSKGPAGPEAAGLCVIRRPCDSKPAETCCYHQAERVLDGGQVVYEWVLTCDYEE